ncbi:hypothetical protein NPIL_509481 [Nephila pilipes]|uniref:Uncharacterized protein n=1 Tax=Nephila pilipes TaxID=299642 RepID=A0A8X6TD11_NEPPI|nr:hypothetical protein NPIL_509481 [Nephila pilipes]
MAVLTTHIKDLYSIEKVLEHRFGDRHLTVSHQAELKVKREKSGERLQELDTEKEKANAFLTFPTEERDNLVTKYFIDAINEEKTQQTNRNREFENFPSKYHQV